MDAIRLSTRVFCAEADWFPNAPEILYKPICRTFTPVTLEIFEPLIATFGVPLIFMAMDYAMRVRNGIAPPEEIMHQIGSDCCILSLGATGAVYVDPHVRHVRGLSSGLTLAITIGFLCLLRMLCLNNPNATNVEEVSHRRSITVGLASILLVTSILVIGYTVGA